MVRSKAKVQNAPKDHSIRGLKKSKAVSQEDPEMAKNKRRKSLKSKRIHTILEQQGREYKLPKQTFKNILKNEIQGICDNNMPYVKNEIRFNGEAVRMLHKATEAWLYQIFDKAQQLARYKGRQTLFADDIYFTARQTAYGSYLLSKVINEHVDNDDVL